MLPKFDSLPIPFRSVSLYTIILTTPTYRNETQTSIECPSTWLRFEQKAENVLFVTYHQISMFKTLLKN